MGTVYIIFRPHRGVGAVEAFQEGCGNIKNRAL